MPKKRMSPDQQLQRLHILANAVVDDAFIEEVRKALGSSSNLVVELAAQLVRQHEIRDATAELRAAYERFLAEPTETDKGCRAKLAVAEALSHADYDDPEFWLDGMKYVQLEAAWGEAEDTASNLRGACAFGLIRSRMVSPAEAMLALVDLLNDSQKLARVHAARAIGATGSPAAMPVLKLKVLVGDAGYEVPGACFAGMLNADSAVGAEFVAKYLASPDDDIAIEAAAAIGESRNSEAAKLLLAACRDCRRELREPFYISAGLTRLSAAVDFLVERIAANQSDAVVAVKALAPARFYPGVAERVAAAVEAADDPRVAAEFAKRY